MPKLIKCKLCHDTGAVLKGNAYDVCSCRKILKEVKKVIKFPLHKSDFEGKRTYKDLAKWAEEEHLKSLERIVEVNEPSYYEKRKREEDPDNYYENERDNNL